MRPLLVALLVAITATAAPSASATTPVLLTGQVMVTGASAGAMRVRAAAPFSLSALSDFSTLEQTPNPDVRVEGRGRVFGIVLTQNTAGRRTKGDNDGPVLIALRYGMCAGPSCAPVLVGKAGRRVVARFVAACPNALFFV